MSISAKSMGVVIGFAFGVIWMTLGVGPAFICAAIAVGGNAIGWVIDGFIEGRLNVSNIWSGAQSQYSNRHLS
ncbi:MAG TPA: hypothetical protein VFV38_26730 [Ktedonobacteraceae bacterium]|nr:hypothetical protein [Ktedonobacteraceae bacterium]